MSKLLKFFLFLSAALVNGSPLHLNEEFVPGLDDYFTTSLNENENELAKEPKVYRLTDDVYPKSYKLEIIPDLEKFTFSGEVQIDLFVKIPTNHVQLHSKNLNIKGVAITNGITPLPSNHKLDEANDLLIVETTEKLAYDIPVVLTIKYEGVLGVEMKGFYRSSYMMNGKDHWLAVTKFEPTYAREAFPCFDEPRFRTPFYISIARFEHQKATSNMPRQAVTPKDPKIGNRVWDRFQITPPMATYLVAFMISELEFISDEEKRVNVWTRGNAIENAAYALKQSPKLLRQLETFTGISYNLPKLDVVAIPDFKAGAMENWGMTTYREKYVIVDEKTSSEQHKTFVTEVIGHEFSHQWFGDLVTPKWWDYLWLNEGFATYFEYFTPAEVEPSWKLDQIFVIEVVQSALWHEITTQRAMTSRLTTISEIKGAFDVISYDKAGSIIRMFEHMVSSKTFKNALHNYLKNGQEKHGGTVIPKYLFEEFDNQAALDSTKLPPGTKVSDIMFSWTNNIGFPLITVVRNETTGIVTIKQTTYKSPRAPKPVPDQMWIVPLTYTTKSELKFSETTPTAWSYPHEDSNRLYKNIPSEDWILFNIQQSGYYRVNYDRDNWHRLIHQLHEDLEKIHPLNRAQLIDDSFTFARDGMTCYHIPLHLSSYLPKEKDLIPWYSATIIFKHWYSTYEATSLQPFIRDYLINLIREPYLNFGFDLKPTDSHLEKIVKPLFLSLLCNIKFDACITKSLEEYNKNKEDLNQIQADLKKVVFCNALKHSDNQLEVFNNLWNYYLKKDIAFDKDVVLMSLSCTTDGEVVKKVLSKLIDAKNKEIRKQDEIFIYRIFFKEIPTVTESITFIHDKVSTIPELDEYGKTALKDILSAIEGEVKTEKQILMLKDLEKKFKELDQEKYGYFTKITQNAITSGAKKVDENEKKAKTIIPTVKEFLPSEPTKAPGSGASILVSTIWSQLTVAFIVLLCGLPSLRAL